MDHPRYIFTDPLVARQRTLSRDLSHDSLEVADYYLNELDGVGASVHRIDLGNPMFARANECLQQFVDGRVEGILGTCATAEVTLLSSEIIVKIA